MCSPETPTQRLRSSVWNAAGIKVTRMRFIRERTPVCTNTATKALSLVLNFQITKEKQNGITHI